MRLLSIALVLGSAAAVHAAPPPAAVANRFYTAFAARDTSTMKTLYAEGVHFHDPVFGTLKGSARTMLMWQKTIGKTPAKVSYQVVGETPTTATVRWQADYKLFGRPVHNEAESHLTIENGEIVKQHDDYSWSRWSRQALPIGGLSRSPIVHAALSGLFRLTLH